jgi:hypothetical protein
MFLCGAVSPHEIGKCEIGKWVTPFMGVPSRDWEVRDWKVGDTFHGDTFHGSPFMVVTPFMVHHQALATQVHFTTACAPALRLPGTNLCRTPNQTSDIRISHCSFSTSTAADRVNAAVRVTASAPVLKDG